MTAEPAQPGRPDPAHATPPRAATSTHPEGQRHDPHATGRRLATLSLAALGVVYGDIGTSPLYALKECFHPVLGVAPTGENVYGVLSLVVWALTLVVSVKYLVFIMRADNRGEGGILALLALLHQRVSALRPARYAVLSALALFGAALLFGEGIITPAISVLGALEGLDVATPVFGRFVPYLTVAILIGLFAMQRFGTARVGRVFGPVMLVWFVTIAALGAVEIARNPGILLAVNPWHAVHFFRQNGVHGFLILGAVVLVITGAEALYADMGHFGKRPIRIAWFAVVFPALLLNYFGQGALLLRDAAAVDNPFYHLVPAPLLYPMLALATAAAVIASQALISGAFSLTRQAVQLGYLPRVTITHTSSEEAGQIYIKEINKALAIFCVLLVLGFQSSSRLAAAYGIAVTGTMVISTLLFYTLARTRFGWAAKWALLFAGAYLVIDLSFFSANVIKLTHGGWVPLAIGVTVYVIMTTWKRGREILNVILTRASLPLELFLEDVERRKPHRVPGTAVFMTSTAEGTPLVLLHHLKHNKVLHDQVVLLTVSSVDVPIEQRSDRIRAEPLGQNIYRVIARYGFMQQPSVREIVQCCEESGVRARPQDTTFYLGRERLIPVRDAPSQADSGREGETRPRMALWRKKLFVFMSRNARSATAYFGIPANRVVELGAQIEF